MAEQVPYSFTTFQKIGYYPFDWLLATFPGSGGQFLTGIGGVVDAAQEFTTGEKNQNVVTRTGQNALKETRMGQFATPVRKYQSSRYDEIEQRQGSWEAIKTYPREASLRLFENAVPIAVEALTTKGAGIAKSISAKVAAPTVISSAIQLGQTYAGNTALERDREETMNNMKVQGGVSFALNTMGNFATQIVPYSFKTSLFWVTEFVESGANTLFEQVGTSSQYIAEQRNQRMSEVQEAQRRATEVQRQAAEEQEKRAYERYMMQVPDFRGRY